MKRKSKKGFLDMSKLTVCTPVHLMPEQANAVKCLAHDAGVSTSEYLRLLISGHLNQKRAEAYATLIALGESSERAERGDHRHV
jgi:hypothetical protein